MARILYVDADVDRVQAVCLSLAARGHEVAVARSAEWAMIQADRQGQFDVVVVDLMLPGIDGAELCRWLKGWTELGSKPRLVFSDPGTHLGLDLQGEMPRWLPADLYIHALDDPARLVEAIDGILRRPPSEGGA